MDQKKLYDEISDYLQHPLDPAAESWPAEQCKQMAAWLMDFAPGRYRLTARRLTLAPAPWLIKEVNYNLTQVLRQVSDYGSVDNVREAIPEMKKKAESAVAVAASEVKQAESHAGKRADHDSLPTEIRAAYEENLPIIQQQRAKFEKMKLHWRTLKDKMNNPNTPACDIEEVCHMLQQAAKEVNDLNDRRLQNWRTYDEYNAATAEVKEEPEIVGNSDAWLSRNIRKIQKLAEDPTKHKDFVVLKEEMQRRVSAKEETGWRAKRYYKIFDQIGINYKSQ